MKILPFKHGDAEWQSHRKKNIGASMAPIVMGVSPWCTPYQLWEIMLGLAQPQEETYAMKRGKELEEEACCRFELQTGIFVTPLVVQHDNYPWMFASLDGISYDYREAVEFKCPLSEEKLIIDGKVPEIYYPQLQHTLAILGLEQMHFFVYHKATGTEEYTMCPRDDEYIKMLICIEAEFMECINTFTPPSLTDRDYIEKNDSEWLIVADYYREQQQALKEIELNLDQARSKLISLANNRNCKGGGVKVSKYVRRGAIDYGRIPELKQIDLEQYRKGSSEIWKIV